MYFLKSVGFINLFNHLWSCITNGDASQLYVVYILGVFFQPSIGQLTAKELTLHEVWIGCCKIQNGMTETTTEGEKDKLENLLVDIDGGSSSSEREGKKEYKELLWREESTRGRIHPAA